MNITGKYFFSKPIFLEKPYGWLQHTPFAFYLIEAIKPKVFVELGTHSGNSYFSFCQAVDELKIGTKCYAVDTWEGDEHASFYGSEVYDRVKRINTQYFHNISYLLKMKFDDALQYFSDGSIDLLHIDGLHTYDAVKHDFESWLPKMSSKGVVIMHDTNVRERGFGVWKLFEEIKQKHPSFEFLHGHGLGVVCVGKSIPPDFLKFVETANKDPFVQQFFATLGNRILAIQERDDKEKEVLLLRKKINQSEKKVEKLEQQINSVKVDIEKRKEKISTIELKLNEHKEVIARKNEKINSVEKELSELKQLVSKRNERIQTLEKNINDHKGAIAKKNERIQDLESSLNDHKGAIAKKNERIQDLESSLNDHKGAITKKNKRIQVLDNLLNEHKTTIKINNEKIIIQVSRIQHLTKEIEKKNERIESLQLKLDEIKEVIAKKNEKILTQEFKIKEYKWNIEKNNDKLSSFEIKQSKLQETIKIKDDHISKIKKEGEELKDKLTNKKNEIDAFRSKQKGLEEYIEKKNRIEETIKNENKKIKETLGVKNKLLLETEENVSNLQSIAKSRKEKIQQYQQTVTKRDNKILDLTNKLDKLILSNQTLLSQLQAKEKEVQRIFGSFSWRITKPIRYVGNIKLISSSFIRIIGYVFTFRKKKFKNEFRNIKYIGLIKKSDLFDKEWYLQKYPDVAESGINPVSHYVRRGASEGRNPSVRFNTRAYLEYNDDVAQSGINPLAHYILFGKAEGRRIFGCSDSNAIVAKSEKLPAKEDFLKQKCNISMGMNDCILYIVHDGGGGMVYISFDMMKYMNEKDLSYILQVGAREWSIYTFVKGEKTIVLKYHFTQHWNETRDLNKERIDALNDLTKQLNPTLVHVRVLIGSGPGIIEFYNEKRIPIVFSFHDFSSVCPNIHLINNGKFCFGNCNLYPNEKDCKYSRSWFGKINPLRPDFRKKWAQRVGAALVHCEAYIVTSEFTKKTILENYPHLEESKFELIEHGREIGETYSLYSEPKKGKPLNVMFFGALNEVKGIQLVLEMMKINNDNNGPIRLHVIGEVVGLHNDYESCNNVILYGKYEREDLVEYFKKIKPSLTILPSICYETFSHTLTESWMFGVPVLGTTYGAVGERIVRERGGWILDPVDPQLWYDKILSISNNKPEYLSAISNVKMISFKTVHQMVNQYYELYQSLTKQKSIRKDIPGEMEKDSNTGIVKSSETNRLQAEREIKKLRVKLLEFGFLDRAYSELIDKFNDNNNPLNQSLAGWELALWHANKQSKDDAKKALAFVSKIARKEFAATFNRRLAIVEAECLEALDDISKAKTIIEGSMSFNVNTDLLLAAANLESSIEKKLSIINRVYEQFGLSHITIDNKKENSAYDSLTLSPLGSKPIEIEDNSAKVTIIVPAYNAANTISTTLNSLIAQTYSNIEILVVDDFSTDNTREILHEYEQKDKRIKLIESKINQGPYVARNHALKIANGDYITCNDSDDWSHPEKIAYQVKHLQENPNAIANISQWARVTPELKFYRRNNPGFYMQINLSSLMFRREAVINRLGYWDSVRYGADTEMHKRLLMAFGAESVVELPPVPLSFARYSETSLTGDPVFGYPGFPMGSRKEYRDSYLHYYSKSKEIKYSFPLLKRPFPIPWMMDSTIEPKIVEQRHFNLVLVSDYRIQDKNVDVLIKEAKSKRKSGFKLGLVHMEIYDLDSKIKFDPNVRELIDGDIVQMLVYGDKVSCDDLVIVHHKVLNDKQMFIPEVNSQSIKVIIDNIPDEFEDVNIIETFKSCNDNLKAYFRDSGIWYPGDNETHKKLSSIINSHNIPVVLSNSIWEHPISSYKWEKVPLNIKNQIRAIETKPKKKEQIDTINENIFLVDIKNIETFYYTNPSGVAVIMPCIDTQMGIDTAKFLLKRAGMDCKIVVVNDTLRKGFIDVLNSTARRTDVKYVVYLAQDAYPGLEWLKLAYESLEETGKGLLAFNCGKWRGRVAAFGMVRIDWVKQIYNDAVLFPGYKAHKADNEITVIARVLDSFVYNPNSTLVEIDKEKVFKENIPEDKELFHERFRNGFNGLLPLEKLEPLAEEYFVPWKKQEKKTSSKDQNEEKPKQTLITSSDTFVLYRIIGNDLYPRHKKGQSRENLKFILENEPSFNGCEKRFVVNRIIDKEEEKLIIELLQMHNCQYIHIPFNVNEYQKIGYDTACFPEPGYLASKEFMALDKNKQDRAIAAAYRLKNNYIMNNNGARNAALNDGLTRAKWVLPWDGNCFITANAWKRIREDIESKPMHLYFAVPMARVTKNEDLLNQNYNPDPVEEPQLIFRNDAKEEFNEQFCYGRRPKVELFWRLGIPGKWDKYPADDPWDIERRPIIEGKGHWGYAGWVARLFSGMEEMEKDTKESIKQRVLARVDGIISTINRVDELVSDSHTLKLTSFRNEIIVKESAIAKQESDSDIAKLISKLTQYADEALSRGRYSVIDKTTLPPSANKNDYWHPAPYWWPNPDTNDGLPYIRKDGERVPGTKMYEPESEKYDRTRLQRVFDDSVILALAWKFTGNDEYAEHAIKIMERFFVDSETRMNPHLMYGQVRLGHNNNLGANTGIIETKDFYYYLDAVRILSGYGKLEKRVLDNFSDWLNTFLEWLLTSSQGKEECAAKNNHGTCYDLQIAAIAAFLNRQSELFLTLARAQSRIPQQFLLDGSQPHELDRTITAHYTCFNFQSWINLAEIASKYNVDLWKYEDSKGASLIKGAEWIVKHMGKVWPYQQIEEFDYDRFLPIFFASKERARIQPNIKNFPKSKYKVKPIFFPHDGIRPFWNIG